jgi:hypothetical protein
MAIGTLARLKTPPHAAFLVVLSELLDPVFIAPAATVLVVPVIVITLPVSTVDLSIPEAP